MMMWSKEIVTYKMFNAQGKTFLSINNIIYGITVYIVF